MTEQTEFCIRLGTDADVELLVSSALEMIRETEGGEYAVERVRSGVLKILANPERGFYVVAEDRGEKIGSLQVSPHWLDLFDGCMWWLQCAYVKPEYRETGCFRLMREFVFGLAEKNPDVKMLRSLVSPKNMRMQKINQDLGWVKSEFFVYLSGMPDMSR